ncbi:MAG: ArsA family ATPase [Actinomycetota bacterium]|nr:ArsA family ATPase [Actinomycetota bacterium]
MTGSPSGARASSGRGSRRGHTPTPPRGSRYDRSVAGHPAFDVDALLDDPSTRIVVCCGSGGVGKTTTAAALGLRAAERGRSVVVLTIDPARRLAQSLGLSELDNTPRPVPGTRAGPTATGRLDAMMLDMKRTFDEVVEAHASPAKARQILANPFYVALSSSFAGTQEYMAMEKLGQLHARAAADGRWDLIIVDTPPSRSALDFLDAPEHLSSLLDGRLIKLLLAPARGPARLLSFGVGVVTAALNKVLGAQVLRDVQTFIAAFDTLFGGFRQRAEHTYGLLQAPGTAFVVIATPEPDALHEATFFIERLAAEHMPLAGLVVNRVLADDEVGLGAVLAEQAAQRLADRHAGDRRKIRGGNRDMTAVSGLLHLHADLSRVRHRQQRLRARLTHEHPEVPIVAVTALAGDVHDLDGLRRIGGLLAST